MVARALDSKRSRGLVWHTQDSGKTYTMIKAAELLFTAPEAENPTILLMIDRNELEDQMLNNLAAVGMGHVWPMPTASQARISCSTARGTAPGS